MEANNIKVDEQINEDVKTDNYIDNNDVENDNDDSNEEENDKVDSNDIDNKEEGNIKEINNNIDDKESIIMKNKFIKKINIIQGILIALFIAFGYLGLYFMFAGGFGDSTYYVPFWVTFIVFIIIGIAIIATTIIRFRKLDKKRNIFIALNVLAIVLLHITEVNNVIFVLDILLVISILYQCRYEKMPKSKTEDEKKIEN